MNQIIVYCTSWCGDCFRARRVLDRLAISYTWVDIDLDPEGRTYVRSINGGKQVVPTIRFPDGDVLVEPGDDELEIKVKAL